MARRTRSEAGEEVERSLRAIYKRYGQEAQRARARLIRSARVRAAMLSSAQLRIRSWGFSLALTSSLPGSTPGGYSLAQLFNSLWYGTKRRGGRRGNRGAVPPQGRDVPFPTDAFVGDVEAQAAQRLRALQRRRRPRARGAA